MSVHLGLDIGSETIGLAVCDEAEVQVRALYTLTRIGRSRDVAAVAAEAARQRAAALVVGLPRLPSGDEGDSARRARRLGELIAEAAGLPFYFQDEAHSSVIARERLEARGIAPAKLAAQIDAEAAKVILERYLSARGGTDPAL